jgi:hypothetical protein
MSEIDDNSEDMGDDSDMRIAVAASLGEREDEAEIIARTREGVFTGQRMDNAMAGAEMNTYPSPRPLSPNELARIIGPPSEPILGYQTDEDQMIAMLECWACKSTISKLPTRGKNRFRFATSS